MTEKILEIFENLKSIMTVSGYETVNAEKVAEYVVSETDGFFEKSEITALGSVIFYHFSENASAKTLLIDAHIDTIGLVVSEICGGGFLRCAPVGGNDRRILPTAEVEIFGKERIRGVFSSVPPHLADKNAKDVLPDFSDFLIDTGKSDDELKKAVFVGAPAVFLGKTERLLENKIASVHLDDKICAAAIIAACKLAAKDGADCNVTLLLSSGEETGEGGAQTAAFVTQADGAVAVDVNFAKQSGVEDRQSSKLGNGAMISRSAATDKRMTDIVIGAAEKAKIPHKIIAEVCGTGTNGDILDVAGCGTPCAVLSVPIKYMHTPCEMCSLDDAQAVASVILRIMQNFDEAANKPSTFLGKRYLKIGGAR